MKKSASRSKTSNSRAKGSPGRLGLLVVVSAPSGAGKTTVVDRLLKRNADWVRSVSVTTREPRRGEEDGRDYFFVTPSRFEQMKASGELLESARVIDNFYGTPEAFVRRNLKDGRCVILAIDIQGARSVRKLAQGKMDLVTVFILPPSLKVLRERLEGRKTESSEQVERRLETAKEEIKEAGEYDLAVVNQDLDDTIREIEAFIRKQQEERSPKQNVLRPH